jgi:hypothetical protein
MLIGTCCRASKLKSTAALTWIVRWRANPVDLGADDVNVNAHRRGMPRVKLTCSLCCKPNTWSHCDGPRSLVRKKAAAFVTAAKARKHKILAGRCWSVFLLPRTLRADALGKESLDVLGHERRVQRGMLISD